MVYCCNVSSRLVDVEVCGGFEMGMDCVGLAEGGNIRQYSAVQPLHTLHLANMLFLFSSMVITTSHSHPAATNYLELIIQIIA